MARGGGQAQGEGGRGAGGVERHHYIPAGVSAQKGQLAGADVQLLIAAFAQGGLDLAQGGQAGDGIGQVGLRGGLAQG